MGWMKNRQTNPPETARLYKALYKWAKQINAPITLIMIKHETVDSYWYQIKQETVLILLRKPFRAAPGLYVHACRNHVQHKL